MNHQEASREEKLFIIKSLKKKLGMPTDAEIKVSARKGLFIEISYVSPSTKNRGYKTISSRDYLLLTANIK